MNKVRIDDILSAFCSTLTKQESLIDVLRKVWVEESSGLRCVTKEERENCYKQLEKGYKIIQKPKTISQVSLQMLI